MDENTFWAVLQVMVLFSKETKAETFGLLHEPVMDFNHALEVFRRHIMPGPDGYGVIAVNDLKKRQRISAGNLSKGKSVENGVQGFELSAIMGLTVKTLLKAGGRK